MSHSQHRQKSNGQSVQQPTTQRQIRDELDAVEDILGSSQNNPLLAETNLGQGNYDDKYLWQQIQSYRHGLVAYQAFADVITDRYFHETIMALGRDGFNAYYDEKSDRTDEFDVTVIPPYDPDEGTDDDFLDAEMLPRDPEYCSSWTLVRERGRAIWQELGEPNQPLSERQQTALARKANADDEWLPLYWEMVAGRHEASRSLDATLMKYVLGKVLERHEKTSDGDSGGILS